MMQEAVSDRLNTRTFVLEQQEGKKPFPDRASSMDVLLMEAMEIL